MTRLSLPLIVFTLVLAACERPNSPDFKLDQKVHTPILLDRTLTFMGGNSGSLIDTTDANFDSLFSTDGSGLVSLSKEKRFDFSPLDGVLPDVTVSPYTATSRVGLISLDDFSSKASLGEAGFQDITGVDPSLVPPGTPMTPGSGTVEFSLETDYLVSATISGNSGQASIDLINELGFQIDDGTVTLKSGATPLNSDSFTALDDGDTTTVTIGFSDGDVLQNLEVEITASWDSDPTTDTPDRLIVSDLQGQNLYASQVEAAVSSQSFAVNDSVDVDDATFRFTQPDHYIELESGQLEISQIVNNIDIAIDTLRISFPDVRTAPYTAADSLVILFAGSSRIPRAGSSLPAPTKNRDLSDLRIYARNNRVPYHLIAVTENTQGTQDSIRTINENDSLSARVELGNLVIRKAVGVLQPRDVPVNNDANGDGAVDLYNDQEAEITMISALNELSDKLDGIEFADPMLTLNYKANIGFASTIYAAMVGADASGNRVFLKGDPGSVYEVTAGEAPASLTSDGSPIASDNLIKFTLDKAPEGGVATGTVRFDRNDTNVDLFFNNLPSNIRFVGLARINEGSEAGSITDPVQFDPVLTIDLPLNFSASDATFSDTVSADLGDLPDPAEDEQRLTEATLSVRYTNGLPFGVMLSLQMLDDTGQEVTRIPPEGDARPELKAAPVDEFTRFAVDGGRDGNLVLDFNSDQLGVLNRTRKMRIHISFHTTNRGNVKVRTGDFISLQVSLKAAVESTIN